AGVVAGGDCAAAGRGGLREPWRAARLSAPFGPVRPGRRAAALLPLVPARRWRSAATRDGLGGPARRRPAAADVADQRGTRAMARPGGGHRVTGRRSGPGRAGPPPRGPPGRPLRP